MCLKTTLCTNKLKVNCTELVDLSEHDSFAKNGSRSARYLEIDPNKGGMIYSKSYEVE